MKKVFGYIRVSTAKQGEKGVSLDEQRDAISRYCHGQNLELVQWFQEVQTAAKQGRPIFNQMLRNLKNRKADGVVLHKIDRGARNLRDWADLAEIIDRGIDIHFANESLDLQSRGGRLSADIQAVVAADFIRNLREETRKGLYGRLKQGFYPWRAPIGYVDEGKAKAKTIHPVYGPLVQQAFMLYATGQYNLDSLRQKVHELGLRPQAGGRISRNGMATLLSNPFYTGLMRVKGKTFSGLHEPLISTELFRRVELIRIGRTAIQAERNVFLYQRLFKCEACGYALTAEMQKGHTYYRCHTCSQVPVCLREEKLSSAIELALDAVRFQPNEWTVLGELVDQMRVRWKDIKKRRIQQTELGLAAIQERLKRLTDAFLDGIVDQELFESHKASVLEEKHGLAQERERCIETADSYDGRLWQCLSLVQNALSVFNLGTLEHKRAILKVLTSNLCANAKNVVVDLRFPFDMIQKRALVPSCDPTGI